jgi:glycosyltransferase involved in cell wall biosynthesis
MKVCYLFREKEKKAHSIEILFDTISCEIQKQGLVVEKWFKPISLIHSIVEVRKLKADIYHITGDCYFLALFLPWNKTIMTIHDIGMYKNFEKTVNKKVFVLVSFILPLKLIKVSTAISELTRNDLIKLIGINPKKIKVIPNPLVLPLSFYPKIFNSKKPVILQIGTGNHKNLIGLIEAVKELECYIDIIGNPIADLIEKMQQYGIEYSISTNISKDEIISKYKSCDILYFASLSEGFGLPILEAQAIGRPVITSNTEPTKSVCGNGGILVDPKNPNEIRESIQVLMNNTSLRNSCIKNGLLNVIKYQKEEIALQYLALYKSFF